MAPSEKCKVSTVVVDTATRVIGFGCTSLLGVIKVLGIRRKDLYLTGVSAKVGSSNTATVALESSKSKVSTVVVDPAKGKAPIVYVLIKGSTTVRGLIELYCSCPSRFGILVLAEFKCGRTFNESKLKVSTIVVDSEFKESIRDWYLDSKFRNSNSINMLEAAAPKDE